MYAGGDVQRRRVHLPLRQHGSLGLRGHAVTLRRKVLAAMCVALASLRLVLSPHGASAQSPPPPAPPAQCEEWEVEYALAGSMQLSDTPMGQGDGTYPIGPGSMALRFEDRGGRPGGRVKLVAYDMRQLFTVVAKTLFWKTTVENNARTVGVVNACGQPEGALDGTTILWKAPINGFRTDGTITCDGSFCGKLGAPPPGESPLHIGPNALLFQPLRFSGDMKTFTMAKTFVAHMDSPQQTAHIAISGRETSRSCRAKACP